MKIENLEHCPVCKEKAKNIQKLNARDFTVTNEIFNIVECLECGFIFTNPRPVQSEIGKYYESSQYISHTNAKETLFDKAYHLVRKYALKGKIKLINTYANNNRSILDYGSGTGAFLESCSNNSWKVTGIEPSKNARNEAKKIKGITIYETIDELNEDAKFQIITLWHVLEHIHQLNETVESLKNNLNQEGRLIIAVPNLRSKDAEVYKENWAAFDVPRHLYHFDKESMNKLMENHGLQIEKIIPMWFDSFYVSMISTKYKYGKTKIIEAFIIGLWSNINAYFNKKEYSSLIYVVRKK
jgi:SAM-dependent methyltransferase